MIIFHIPFVDKFSNHFLFTTKQPDPLVLLNSGVIKHATFDMSDLSLESTPTDQDQILLGEG